MHNSVDNLIAIQKEIQLKTSENKSSKNLPEIIAVSKTFMMENIIPLINHGHLHFGENKVQEAIEKWENIKSDFSHLNLHMIGKLQTNKVKHAVSLFDYIHSLDNFKLAEKIFNEQEKQNKKIKIFIQVNLGEEDQKSGILLKNLNNFYTFCAKELSLNIIGLMCIPPANHEPTDYFKILKSAADKLSLKDLSMGMSSDFETALLNGSTYLRLGSVIMGKRNVN